jgi:lipopolysaccharide/colanic/teichoic acid biosynthesis glycosyltransferase
MTTLTSAFRQLWDRPTTEESIRGEYVGLEPIVTSRAARSMVKRSMDVAGALGGLIFLSPLLVLIAVLIRLDSRGTVLFRQRRVGLCGRSFSCFKFRTMVFDAESRLLALEAQNESSCGVLFKIKNDPRVTFLGRVLRRTSLDELPQLWNILVGDMSLVGPRPLQYRDSQKLEALDAEGYARRLTVLPGLTGPWQVAGRSELDGEQMLDLDLDYVENWSIALDLKLLVKTIGVVLACRGAS